MANEPRPTLKTIAQLTGLAVPTVSRALSGAEDIGKATRERVRQIANEIGYVPNRAGVRLRTGRTHVISLVLSTEADVMNLTARLINSVASALRDTSYHLTITPYFPDEDPMRPIRHVVETRAADAVILNQVQPEDPRIAYLMEREFPFATHGRTNWADDHAYYDFDNHAFGALAVEKLLKKGRSSLRLLAPPVDQNYSQAMISGALQAAQMGGVELEVFRRIDSDDPSDKIQAHITQMFRNGLDVDGIIFGSANSCMAAVTGIEDAGLTVGGEIDLVSKEAIPFLHRFRPAILSQQEDAWAAGVFLAQAVIERIEQPDKALMQQLEIPGQDRRVYSAATV
ncbi:LacI family transcriptional regulator [Actibacterium sp. 188UL27-1]|uniref:LacI family transcriptional regulator n=1 Tax=Actibacterium sp. 188UL27-1 TaxID=2786961 RepID=UPI00195ACDB8|nr:LacI family transcriptional regulator [Actibacterium sp. 188UL27-1]MBM7068394.1 LacI family DNA-binding transcriptional regulator [Actibacterium sp. 188UL27-1]